MANLSDLTRKDQVFQYLKTRLNAWVDGTELANAEVGGSEGLKRLRELRKDLAEEGTYEIEMRGHPDPDKDIYQYRLTNRVIVKPDIEVLVDRGEVVAAVAHTLAGAETLINTPNVEIRRGAGRVVYDKATDTYVAVYDGPIPLPTLAAGQVDMGVPEAELHKYTSKPSKLEMGVSILCPMCKGIHRAIKEKDPVTGKAAKQGKILGYEEKTRDPRHPSNDCPRCDGWGLIPA